MTAGGVDTATLGPILGAAVVLLGLGGLAFQRVYAWIQSEAGKQREEREKAITAQRLEMADALSAQETKLNGQFNARILALETHIKVLEGRIAEDEKIRRVVVAECGMGLVLDSSPEVRACFQKILQAAG